MPLDPADVALLQAVLRSRQADPERLARALRRPRREIDHGLARLSAAGFLADSGSGVVPVAPSEPLLAEAARVLAEHIATAAELASDLAALPALLRDWEWGGQRSELPLLSDVVHGPLAIIESWWRYADSSRPIATVNVTPDARAFAQVPEDDIERLLEYVGPNGGGIRIIVARDSLEYPEARRAVDGLLAVGLQVRTMAEPPGWFFADGDVVAALPSHWGDPWPTSVLLVRNPVIPAALTQYFEELWVRALPVADDFEDWEPVLRLLAEGLTDDEVAEQLSLSPRTVRRRITEAMEEFGASNRFTLGRAWGRLSD
jgi:hypothetical protein